MRKLTRLLLITACISGLLSEVFAQEGYFDGLHAFGLNSNSGTGLTVDGIWLPNRNTMDVFVYQQDGDFQTATWNEQWTNEYQQLGINQSSLEVPYLYSRPQELGTVFSTLQLGFYFHNPTDELVFLVYDVDELDRVQLHYSDYTSAENTDFSDWTVVSGDMTNASLFDPPVDAPTPQWDPLTGTISTTDSSDYDRNFIALRPNHPITGISVADYVPAIPGEGDVAFALYSLPFLPGDFNENGRHDCEDVDSLVQHIVDVANGAPVDLAFDVDGRGSIDAEDLSSWRWAAGRHRDLQYPILEGDANLDGVVDVSDFNRWNEHKFTETAAWCNGDFNADGVVDVDDFNLWNRNKFRPETQLVPEPGSLLQIWVMTLICFASLRRLRRQD